MSCSIKNLRNFHRLLVKTVWVLGPIPVVKLQDQQVNNIHISLVNKIQQRIQVSPHLLATAVAFDPNENHSLLYDLYLRLPQRRPLASRVRRDTLPTNEEDCMRGDDGESPPSIGDSARGLDNKLHSREVSSGSQGERWIWKYMDSGLSSIPRCSCISGCEHKPPRSSGRCKACGAETEFQVHSFGSNIYISGLYPCTAEHSTVNYLR